MNFRILITAILLSLCTFSNAAQLELGEQTGTDFTYDAKTQYVSINLKDLNLPALGDDESNGIAKFFKALFLDRKKYGIAYIEVKPEFGNSEKSILFTYEKDSDDRYKYKYVGASQNITYKISRPFIYQDPVALNIVIKEWEAENSGAVKKIISAAESSTLGAGYGEVLSNITMLLGLVENLFPANSTEEALSLKLSPDDLQKQDIQILGDDADFFKLSLKTENAFFEDYDLTKGILRAKIENLDAWKNVISAANSNLSSDGLEPLVAVAQSYSGHVTTLPLNSKDQAILTACSIKEWATNAVNGVIEFEDKPIQYTAHDYSQLATSDLQLVRGSKCDFKGVNCNTAHCMAMSDFINKSSRTAARRRAAELYIDDELNISLAESEILLTVDDFISSFRITRPAFFNIEATGPSSWSYHFLEDQLDLRVNGIRYKPYTIRIDMAKDDISEGKNYIITGIEINNQELVASLTLD